MAHKPSTETIRMQLLSQLNEGGALTDLKAQLREEIAQGLSPASRRTSRQSSRKQTRRLLNYLIEDYLKANDYQYSLSVFQPEAGCGNQQMDHESIKECLKLEPGSELYSILQRKGFGSGPGLLPSKSLALCLLESIAELGGRQNSLAAATQRHQDKATAAKQAEIDRLKRRQEELEDRLASFEARMRASEKLRAPATQHRQPSSPGFFRIGSSAGAGGQEPLRSKGAWRQNVHARLQQAAARSRAVQATEAVWMGWAQQSDGLLDEVMAGQEGMVRCVEEARLAVCQAEAEAGDLRETVAQLQRERQRLLDRLPDGKRRTAASSPYKGGQGGSPPRSPHACASPARAAGVQQAEREIKADFRALENKVFSQRQAATAQLAHVLACAGLGSPPSESGWSELSAGGPTAEHTNATAKQPAAWHDMHDESQQASPGSEGLHLAFPSAPPVQAHQPRSEEPHIQGWQQAESAHERQPPMQPAAPPAAAISPTIQIGAVQISLLDGTISFDGGATKLALAALPQAVPNLAPVSALPVQAKPPQPQLEQPLQPAASDVVSMPAASAASEHEAANMDQGGSRAILSGLLQPGEQPPAAGKPMPAMQSPFRSRDQQPPPRARPAASLHALPPSSDGRLQPADSIPIMSGLSPAKQTARAGKPASAKTATPSQQPTSETQPVCEEANRNQVDIDAAKQEKHAAFDDTAHLPLMPAEAGDEQPGDNEDGHEDNNRAEDSSRTHAFEHQQPDPMSAYQHAQGYDVFAGQRAPDSPVRTASTSLLAGDGSNYFLGSDHGPLILNLDAMAPSQRATGAGSIELSSRGEGKDQEIEQAQTLSPSRKPPHAHLLADGEFPAMSSMDMSLAERGEIYHAQSRSKPVMRFFPSLAQHDTELSSRSRPATAFVSRSPPQRPVEALPDSLSAPQLAHDDMPVAAFHSNPLAIFEDGEDAHGASAEADIYVEHSRPSAQRSERSTSFSGDLALPAGPVEVSDFLDQQYLEDWSDVPATDRT